MNGIWDHPYCKGGPYLKEAPHGALDTGFCLFHSAMFPSPITWSTQTSGDGRRSRRPQKLNIQEGAHIVLLLNISCHFDLFYSLSVIAALIDYYLRLLLLSLFAST